VGRSLTQHFSWETEAAALSKAQHPKIFSYPQAGPADYPIFRQQSRISANEARYRRMDNPDIGATMYAYVHPSGFNALV
jgi:hypothetical protein